MTNDLKAELESFWKWSESTPELYSKNGWNKVQAEWEYPQWDILFNKTIDLIQDNKKIEEDYNLILEVMALDNEGENILSECENYLPEDELELLIKNSIKYSQTQARWQVAELIGRKGIKKFDHFLLSMINDNDKYVQRRALISLTKINPIIAEDILFSKLSDSEDYIRLVSIRMLREINSHRLVDAINLLKNDKFKYIIEEINEISSSKIFS